MSMKQKFLQNLVETANKFREEMIETAVENDEAAMEDYLEGNEPTEELKLRELIRIGTISAEYFPVFCGSAFKNKGVQPLLDAVVDFPSISARYSCNQGY